MTEYGIWLSFNNQEEGFQLPVNPESIDISESGQGQTYEVASGEINVIKAPELSSFSFSSLFPSVDYPFVTAAELLPPFQYVHYLLKWMETKRPIRFVFTGPTFDINIPASIEEFQWREAAGASGDLEFDLTLKKYRFFTAKRVTVDENTNTATSTQARPDERAQPNTYRLVAGDNLWKVATAFLGNGSRYPEIQRLNGISDAQLKSLPIGLEIKLPPK